MTIEDELRGALDVPAPPPATTLDDVLRRGRRRVAVRRAGLAGGVLAVVAVVGIGSTVWQGTAAPELDLGANPANWGQVSDPARRKQAEEKRPELGCFRTDFTGSPVRAEPLSSDLMRTIQGTVRSVLPDRTVDSALPEEVENNGSVVFEVDVLDGQGAGSLRFWIGRFEAEPVVVADYVAWVSDTCSAPRRQVAPDGTVYQLNVTTFDGAKQASLQSLSIFRKNGRSVRIDQVGAGRTSSRATRDTLPLSEAELVKLGAAVAEVS